MRSSVIGIFQRSESIAAVCVFAMWTIYAGAQVPDPVTSAGVPLPGYGHSYIGMGAETVNPADGSLTFDLPIQTPAGRGLSMMPYHIKYHTGQQFYLSTYNNLTSIYPALQWNSIPNVSDWDDGLPLLTFQATARGFSSASGQGQTFIYHQCDSTGSFIFKGLDGTEYNLAGPTSWSDPSLPPDPNFCPYQSGISSSQSGILLSEGTPSQQLWPGEPPLTITDQSGTTYKFAETWVGSLPTATPFPWTAKIHPQTITDRNGNQLTAGGNGTSSWYTDTLGRQVISWGSGPLTIAGLGQITTVDATVNTTFPGVITQTGGCHKSTSQPNAGLYHQITEIDLPGTPSIQKYLFTYDSTYGRVSKITFPAGGYVRYVWGLNPKSTHGNAQNVVVNSGVTTIQTCSYDFDTPAIVDRYVSYDGQTEILHQHFTYSTTMNPSSGVAFTKQTTVSASDLLTGQSTVTIYNYGPVSTQSAGWQNGYAPVETSVVYQDGAGHTLKTENKTWFSVRQQTGDQTILDNGQGNATQRCYDLNEQVTAVFEYGFQSEGTKPADPSCYRYGSGLSGLNNSAIGPLRRQTTTAYHTFAAGTHIIDSPDSVTVADGSGSTVKQTTFTYTDTVQSSGTTVGLVAPPGANRGNIASISKLVSSGNAITTGYAYFDNGNLQSVTDGCGNTACSDVTGANHTTTYSYTDNFSVGSAPGQTNAYLTQVTYPNTGVAHSGSFSWGYADGKIRSLTDQNNQTTSFQYNDPLVRLTQISYPDGGSTTVTYNDSTFSSSANTPNFVVTEAIKAGLSKTTESVFDGMGHEIQNQLTSDPQGTNYIVTAYDGFGRTRLTYNPTRCNPPTSNCGESTWGLSTRNYDALGRLTSLVQQDGSTATTSYAGNCTTVTDEAGKSRKSCTEGLGRLSQVFEDPSGSNFETDYTYNTLDNLLTVNQKGNDPNSANWRPRTFTYDFLSRLLTANNPESGTMTYSYDANSNLASKVAPQPNQTGTATVTTNYTYDVLNRLTGKSYVGLSTAAVKYGYDAVALSGCTTTPPALTDTYPKGLRTSMCDGSGATSWKHDQIGRVLSESRIVVGTSPWTKTAGYTYNLDGSIATISNPGVGRVMTYTTTGAGRQSSVVNTGGSINFVTGATYAPSGELANYTNGGIINTTDTYNTRLQPISLAAATTGGAIILSLSYDFHSAAHTDNGNVYQIANGRDANRTQNFIYDSLNRIQQAYTTGPNWGETFSPTSTGPGVPPATPGIDAWGNLTNRSGVTGKTMTESFSAAATTQNRLTGFGYDAAGNMTSNGSATYTYDAENRLTSTAGWTYVYDGDGHRVRKSSGSTGTLYWPDLSGETLNESSLGATNLHEYVYFGGKRVARIDVPTPLTVKYYFSDHLGSANVIADSSGNIVEESDYYPYGGEIAITNNDGNNYKFTGKERDAESGLDNFGARYDSSALGRFMTPDWAGKPTDVPYAKFGDPQTLNLYAFVENAPVNQADADGHCGPVCGAIEDFVEAEGPIAVDWAKQGLAAAGALIATGASAAMAAAPNVRDASCLPCAVNQNNRSIALSKDNAGGGKNVPNPNGSKGAPDHQQTADEEAAKMGPNGQREVRVDTPGGEKGTRVIDAAKVENGKVTEATQVIRPNKSGTPPAREVRAANDIQKATGVQPKMVPVRPCTTNNTGCSK